ncbi:MAG: guanylate kinase [Desulfovibrio sp.]|nr:guanylate kinase [Desulfovibrio sp.]
MPRKGIALVLSAPSGAGKSTLTAMLRKEFPDLAYSVSCTTRKPRPGEVDGRDYHFVSESDFLRQREAGGFAEWAQVHGNYYGTPLVEVTNKLDQGFDILFDIDVQGAAQLKLNLFNTCFIFILPPSLEELEHRLRLRGTESEESIQARLHNAYDEIKEARWYDALIVNDDLETAYLHLRSVYLAATLTPACQPELLQSLLQGGNH